MARAYAEYDLLLVSGALIPSSFCSELTLELATLRNKEKKEVKERVVGATRLKQQLDLAILKANAEVSLRVTRHFLCPIHQVY